MTTTANLDIRIRAFIDGMNNLSTVVDNIRGVGSASTDAAHGASVMSHKGKELGTQLEAMGEGYSKLTGYIKAAAAAFVGFLAVQGVKELADYAARSETLGITLGVVSKNAGYSKDQIAGYEKGLEKLGITTQAARTSMTAMIQAGLPLGPMTAGATSNVERLARAAQDLAVVTGENSSYTFQRMITNIQQMDTMGLRFMGLNINIQAAQEKFATSINKTTAALTQQQKIQAVNNAVLEEATKLQGAYELSMESVGKKVSSMTRYQEQLSQAIGQHLLPAYGAIVDSATLLLKHLESIAKGMDSSGEASKHFGGVIGQLADTISYVVEGIASFVAANVDILESIGANVVGIITDIVQLAASFFRLSEAGDPLKAVLWGIGFVVAGLRDGFSFLRAGVLIVASAFLGVAGNIAEALAALAGMVPGLGSLSTVLKATAQSLYNTSQASEKLADQIVTDFANGRTATQDFLKGVKTVHLAITDFGKATSFSQVQDEFKKLSKATDDQAISLDDVKEAGARTVKSMIELAQQGKLTDKQILQLVDSAIAAGQELPAGFTSGAEAAKTLKKQLEAARVSLDSLGKATSFKGIEEDIRKLTEAQRLNALTSTEQKVAVDLITASITKFGEAGGAPEEVAKAMNALDGVVTKLQEDWGTSVKNMGIATEELKTGVTKNVIDLSGSLTAMASSALTTSQQFTDAFEKGLDTAKTLLDLNAVGAAVDAIKKRAQELLDLGNLREGTALMGAATQAVKLMGVQFDKAFDTQLKAAKSVEDFTRLHEAVKEYGTRVNLGTEAVKALHAQVDAFSALTPKVAAAYEGLGLKTSAALQLIADTAKKNLEVLQKFGAAGSTLDAAWKTYAEAAIKANNGVADSTLRAQAGMHGFKIEVDAVGQATVQSMKDASLGVRMLESAIPGVTTAYEKLGVKSTEALIQVADEARKNLTLIDASGASLDTQNTAWGKWAKAAIEANNGIIPDIVRAEAAQHNFTVEIGKTGEEFLRMGATAAEALALARSQATAAAQATAGELGSMQSFINGFHANLRDLGGAMGSIINGYHQQFRSMSDAADQFFTKSLGSIGAVGQSIGNYLHDLRRFSEFVTARFKEQEEVSTGLVASLKSHGATVWDIARGWEILGNQAREAGTFSGLLGEQQLLPLRQALADAVARMQQLRETAQSTLASLLDEWDQINNTTSAMEVRHAAARKAEIESQLAVATASKDSVAIAALTQALQLLDKVSAAKVVAAQETDAQAALAKKTAAQYAAEYEATAKINKAAGEYDTSNLKPGTSGAMMKIELSFGKKTSNVFVPAGGEQDLLSMLNAMKASYQ